MDLTPTPTNRRGAVVGCGDISVVHTEAISALPGMELVAVVDTDPARLEVAVERTGVTGYSSVEHLLEAGGVDVVHVTTPHDQHAPVTLACIDAGVHVLQEKPIAHTLDAGDAVAAAAAAHPEVKVGICYQNRYNISSIELKRLLDSGELGQIRGAVANVMWTRTADYYRARPWRGRWATAGGGLLINQAIHTLDLVAWLLGEPVEVNGSATQRKFAGVTEVEDTADALFTHPDGITTSWYATLTAPTHRPVEFEVVGENGTATLRDGLHVTWADGRVEHFEERTASSSGRSYWGVSHELLINDFYTHLADPEPFWIGPEQALSSMRMLTSIYDQSPTLTARKGATHV